MGARCGAEGSTAGAGAGDLLPALGLRPLTPLPAWLQCEDSTGRRGPGRRMWGASCSGSSPARRRKGSSPSLLPSACGLKPAGPCHPTLPVKSWLPVYPHLGLALGDLGRERTVNCLQENWKLKLPPPPLPCPLLRRGAYQTTLTLGFIPTGPGGGGAGSGTAVPGLAGRWSRGIRIRDLFPVIYLFFHMYSLNLLG